MESLGNFQFSSEESNVNWTNMQPCPFRNLPHNNYNRADDKPRLKILNLPSLYTLNRAIMLPSKTTPSKYPAMVSGDNSKHPNPVSPNRNSQTSSSSAPKRTIMFGKFTTPVQQNENKGLLGSCNKASSAQPNPGAGILGSHPAGMSYQTAQAIKQMFKTNIARARKLYTQVQLEMKGNQTFSPKARKRSRRSNINIRGPRGNVAPRGVKQQQVRTPGNDTDVSGKAKLNPENEEDDDDSDSNYPFPGHLINMDDYN